MGRKSIKENKNIYQLCREECDYTREEASEKMIVISPERIEKIENEKTIAHPDEVLTMAKCYKHPQLSNYYCTHECMIGQKYVQEVKEQELSGIVLSLLNSINDLYKQKERLVEITVDGKVSEAEEEDFNYIQKLLKTISVSSSALEFWMEKEKFEEK